MEQERARDRNEKRVNDHGKRAQGKRRRRRKQTKQNETEDGMR